MRRLIILLFPVFFFQPAGQISWMSRCHHYPSWQIPTPKKPSGKSTACSSSRQSPADRLSQCCRFGTLVSLPSRGWAKRTLLLKKPNGSNFWRVDWITSWLLPVPYYPYSVDWINQRSNTSWKYTVCLPGYSPVGRCIANRPSCSLYKPRC